MPAPLNCFLEVPRRKKDFATFLGQLADRCSHVPVHQQDLRGRRCSETEGCPQKLVIKYVSTGHIGVHIGVLQFEQGPLIQAARGLACDCSIPSR